MERTVSSSASWWKQRGKGRRRQTASFAGQQESTHVFCLDLPDGKAQTMPKEVLWVSRWPRVATFCRRR
eukprot:11161079-Lingulodinium_polyedra.AAC.1